MPIITPRDVEKRGRLIEVPGHCSCRRLGFDYHGIESDSFSPYQHIGVVEMYPGTMMVPHKHGIRTYGGKPPVAFDTLSLNLPGDVIDLGPPLGDGQEVVVLIPDERYGRCVLFRWGEGDPDIFDSAELEGPQAINVGGMVHATVCPPQARTPSRYMMRSCTREVPVPKTEKIQAMIDYVAALPDFAIKFSNPVPCH